MKYQSQSHVQNSPLTTICDFGLIFEIEILSRFKINQM